MTFLKRYNKTIISLSALFFFCYQSQGQDYFIQHDFQKNNTNFYKLGRNHDTAQVKSVSLRRPGRITLKVDNFNPFYWNAKVTVFKKPVDEESSNIGSFISSLTKGMGVSSMFPTRSGSLSEANQQKLEMLTRRANQFSELAWQLDGLQMNIKKTEEEIKSEARKAVRDVMGTDSLSVKDARLLGQELETDKKEVNAAISGANQTIIRYSFTDTLAKAVSLYHSIIYTDFKFQYSVNGNPDINELKLAIFARSDVDPSSRDTLTRYFPVEGKANLRLRNSVGVTFSHFPDKNRSYFINPDLTIGSGTGDLFTPVLSAYINFYNYKVSGLRWGGAFGFGVPMIGDKKDINFMLGLCGVVGRNEPIILSAGFAGARVERLTEGWKVGGVVPSLSFDIPTLSQFRVGGYISVTFNMSAISSKKSSDD
ncbi:MAG: hypothetical protein SGI83_11225 [Bacteroidota bacterium]|nr:hypothetical protein [Bacteroidota bacterium]